MAGKRKLTLGNADGVWKRPDGRFGWEFRTFDKHGKEFRKAGSRSTLEDANASYLAAQEELRLRDSGEVPKHSSDRTLDDWSKYCLDSLWPLAGLSSREIDNRRSSLGKHFLPTLGSRMLDQVTKADVRTVLGGMQTKGSSWDTRRNARNAMSALFESAIKEFPKVITENPAEVEIGAKPKRDKGGNKITHIRILEQEEVVELLKVSDGDPYWIGIYLAATLGLRRGEILGLRWTHIDSKEKTLYVRDNVQRSVGQGLQTNEPKTVAGEREIPLPKHILATLESWRSKQSADQEFVMPSPLGAAPEPRKFSKAMEDFRVMAKLCGKSNKFGEPLPDPTLHDLRHTFASYMANVKKVSANVLQTILGHEDVTTTLNYYVKTSPDAMREAMNLLDD